MHVSAAAQRGASDQSHSCPLVPAEVSQHPRVELLTLFSFLYNGLATQAQAVLIFVLFLFFSNHPATSIAFASSSQLNRPFNARLFPGY